MLGSYVATFAQGLALGAFIQGIAVEGRAYAGGWFDWLTPFSVFTGVALVFGYALLGACFLIMKTEGRAAGAHVHDRAAARHRGPRAAIAVVSALDAVPRSGASRRAGSRGRTSRCFRRCRCLCSLIALGLFRSLAAGREVMPFVMAILLFLISYLGVAVSVYPYIVPRAITV